MKSFVEFRRIYGGHYDDYVITKILQSIDYCSEKWWLNGLSNLMANLILN